MSQPYNAKKAQPPGTPIYTGPEVTTKPLVHIIKYTSDTYDFNSVLDWPLDKPKLKALYQAQWLRVIGIHNSQIIETLGHLFSIHLVSIEDLVNVHLKPKIEEFPKYLLISLRFPLISMEELSIHNSQIGILLLPDLVISFEESDTSFLENIQKRIELNKGRIRKESPAYLAYTMIDLIIDEYVATVEQINQHFQQLEQDLLNDDLENSYEELFHWKQFLNSMIHAIRPVVNVTSRLNLIHTYQKDYPMYVRDVHDHAESALNQLLHLNDALSGLIHLNMSIMAQRQNEITKTLTVVGSIFIPLTFLAGIYGMNIKHMPELSWPYMYPTLLGSMLVLALGMLYYFKRKGIF